MAHDPYAPPGARVEDRGEDADTAGRPRQVTAACRLLWLAIALDFLTLHPAIRGDWWGEMLGEGDDETLFGLMLVGFALAAVVILAYAVLTFLISRRNNVARWLMLAVLALSWLVTLGEFADTLEQTPLAALADALLVLLELAACYLLFLSPGAAWFRRPAGRR